MKGLEGVFALVILVWVDCMHCLHVLGFEYRISEVHIVQSRKYRRERKYHRMKRLEK